MNKNIIGYCIYCKDEIYEDEVYVTKGDYHYHKECYELIEPDFEEGDFEADE